MRAKPIDFDEHGGPCDGCIGKQKLYEKVRAKLKAEQAVFAEIKKVAKRAEEDGLTPSTGRIYELDKLSRVASQELLDVIDELEEAAT